MTYLEKKRHNNYNKNGSYKCHILRFGEFGIKATDFGRVTEIKLDLLLRSLNKKLKSISKGPNFIKTWTLVPMNSTLTILSPESRMGKGKGSIYTKSAFIKPGQVIIEFSNISLYQAISIFKYIRNRVSFNIKLIKI